MLKELIYAEGAQKLVSHNANVRENEKVLVVADYPMADIAARVANAARACGAEVVVSYMAPREWGCQEPLVMIAVVMLEADVIFSPVTVSIAWSGRNRFRAQYRGKCHPFGRYGQRYRNH